MGAPAAGDGSLPVTKEAQNQLPLEEFAQMGPCTMGPWTSHSWRNDPRHLSFVLSRYKFVSKMLAGKRSVLEIGCGDAIGLPIVRQVVESVHGVDFEPVVIDANRRRFEAEGMPGVTFAVHDLAGGPVPGTFEAGFSLDVIEHVPHDEEETFVDNIVASIEPNGVLILGTPNKTAEQYASPISREGHINLQTAESLRRLVADRFHNVFSFSMNDEVVHTGYAPMAHYLLVIGAGVKTSR